MSAFRDIQNKHTSLLAHSPDEGVSTDEIRTFINEIVKTSKKISSVGEREQLRAILRYWLNYIYEKDGEYLSVELAPGPQRFLVPHVLILTVLIFVLATDIFGQSLIEGYQDIISNLPTKTPTSTSTPSIPETGPVLVNIRNTDPKVEKAIVHILGTDHTDNFDQNILALPACSRGESISVWAPGYYILTFPCVDGLTVPYTVELEKFNQSDNSNYAWLNAGSCKDCHSEPPPDLLNEYSEWEKYGHSQAFVSTYFSTTYMGTNVNGRPSQQTQWSILENGEKIRLALDPSRPDFGAGYRLDYPVSNGNCGLCHVPAGSSSTSKEIDIAGLISSSHGNRVNAATEGVTCDLCIFSKKRGNERGQSGKLKPTC